MTKRIQPFEVERDEDGYWVHPAFPSFEDELLASEWRDFLRKHGLEAEFVGMEGDAPDEVTDRYFELGDPDCSAWTPTSPTGEGWFLFGIWDTEDGPTSCWVRNVDH